MPFFKLSGEHNVFLAPAQLSYRFFVRAASQGQSSVLARKGEGRAHADVRLQLRMKIFWANQIHNI